MKAIIAFILIAISAQQASYTEQYPYLQRDADKFIKCMEIDEQQLNVWGNSDDYYVCMEKEEFWLAKYLSITYKRHEFEIKCEVDDEVIERLKSQRRIHYIIMVEEENYSYNLTFYALTLIQENDRILVTKVAQPDYLRSHKNQIQQLINGQMEHRQYHKHGGYYLRNILFLITVTIIIGFAIYCWKKRKTNENEEKNFEDLQQNMLYKMEREVEEQKKQSNENIFAHMTEMKEIPSQKTTYELKE